MFIAIYQPQILIILIVIFFPCVIVLPRLANATCRPVSLSCIFAVIYYSKVEVDLLLCCKMFDINI